MVRINPTTGTDPITSFVCLCGTLSSSKYSVMALTLGASSSSAPLRMYDAFLSFYGEDTHKNFTDHLYAALKRKGIICFRDDEKLERGKYISQELLKAIQKSQYAVVVISKRYAFSRWCLIELTEIMKCRKEIGLIVLPVFYDVDPSDVQKQEGSFAEAFSKHSENIEVKEEQRKMWRAALKEVGHLVGWDLGNRHEAAIVEDISRKILFGVNRTSSNIFEGLVGIGSQVAKLISLLCMGSDDVQFVGICGMGGIGKTTLAKVIYDQLSPKFEASCFIANIREESRKYSLVHQQKQLICEILGESRVKVWNIYAGIDMIASKVCNKNVFIVLDDVDIEDQLKALAGSHDWFGPRSRVIVTSRDKNLLRRYVNNTYEVKGLNSEEALQLFSCKAFKKPYPKKDFVEISQDIVYHAHGLPLALEVIGSLLLDRTMSVWKQARNNFITTPHTEILDALQISFEGLDDSQKELFLDIACFFYGKIVSSTMYILEGNRRHLDIDIEVLKDKCLINISCGTLWMHDLLRKLGQQIVYRESPREPGKRSRLWCSKDIIHVLKHNTGTDAIESIVLSLPLQNPKQLSIEAFSKMKGLKMLIIGNKDPTINFSKSRENLRTLRWYGNPLKFKLNNELTLMEWMGYPLKSLPTSFQPNALLEIRMRQSCIKHLWQGPKGFSKLRHLDLTNSENLLETPDFSKVPELEKLELAHCTSLSLVHPSIGFLKSLKRLNLRGCTSLKRLPAKIYLGSLEELDLSDCSMLERFPDIVGDMKSLQLLYLTGTAIQELPSSFERLSSLVHFSLSRCFSFEKIPDSLSGMESLERLLVDGTAIRELPSSIVSLKKLRILNVGGRSSNPTSFWLPNSFSGLSSLRVLNLSYRNLLDRALPNDLSCLSSLTSLNLSGNNITIIPESISSLSSLRKLHLSNCNLLDRSIPIGLSSLSSLQVLDLSGNKFTQIPDTVCQLFNLLELYLEGCGQLKALPKLPLRLGHLHLKNCPSLNTFFNQMNESTTNKVLHTFDLSFLAAYFGYDGKSYKILHLHKRSPLWIRSRAQGFDTLVACGLASGCGTPEWFNQESTGSFGRIRNHKNVDLDDNLKGWKGYALFIDFQVHMSDSDRRKRKRGKAYEYCNTSFRLFDGSNPTFPYFVCEFQTDKAGVRKPLVLCAPEVPIVGRNGFWVYIPAEWFEEQENNLDEWRSLKASIATCSRNVVVNHHGLRLVRQNDFSQFSEVLSSISPHGLKPESWEKLLCLHKDFKALKVKGPIKGNIVL